MINREKKRYVGERVAWAVGICCMFFRPLWSIVSCLLYSQVVDFLNSLKKYFKKSLIIHEENQKEITMVTVILYVIKSHVNQLIHIDLSLICS